MSNDLRPFQTFWMKPLDKWFEEFLQMPVVNSFSPKVDIAETKDAFELSVQLPGVNKEDIKVELDGNLLTISGERKFNKEESDKTWRKVESFYGAFSRSFTLPENVDKENIKANSKDGILLITVPKKVQEKKSNLINIE
ncbi:MAG: heat-shock protein Hsp20 [Bacteroidia bacterium]|nr:MAG: heat-shock protein Hsp20 [Bacteroidia bacterium]